MMGLEPPKKYTSGHICGVFPERLTNGERAILVCRQHLPKKMREILNLGEVGDQLAITLASWYLLPYSELNVTSRLKIIPSS